jgi:hypothetical protein
MIIVSAVFVLILGFNKNILIEFTLKPRKRGDAFWRWGVLLPLMSLVVLDQTAAFFNTQPNTLRYSDVMLSAPDTISMGSLYYPYSILLFNIIQFLVVLFGFIVTFRTCSSPLKGIGFCILQFVVANLFTLPYFLFIGVLLSAYI